ncbi:hypothetical protein [Nonomuraea pusilla]|uniref:Uncharacterized protein n=1 Tax=Nonomuraea pusilla TaxID=46177 RepID=A0A1H8K3G3_9ACTN|nr:hypothetical protein [Nonomuraea pusilla]SEN87464.1 hypothetical protein SAMN05660976_08512 [Nonomuraea pusilla]
MPTIFGREPAVILGFLSAALQLLTAFVLPLTSDQVGALNAVAAAAVGVWTAAVTRAADGGSSIQSAVLGFAQAGITLALVFGLSLSDEQTASIMAFVAMGVSMFVRQVSSPKTLRPVR